MIFSYNLIKRFINIPWENLQTICDKNNINIKLIKERKLPETMVIWKSIKVEKHPNADRLFVCQIDCGTHGIFQILTWGENIVEWVYLPIALPWTYLSEINIKIEPRKMRWIESNWMICSKEEIWINEDTDKHWIWILNEEFDDITDEDLWKPLNIKYPWFENNLFKIETQDFDQKFFNSHFAFWLLLNILSKDSESIKFNKIPHILDTIYHTNIKELLENATQKQYDLQLENYIAIHLSNPQINKTSFYNRVNLLDMWNEPINNYIDFKNLLNWLYWYEITFNENLQEKNIWDQLESILIINNIWNQKSKLYASIIIIDELKFMSKDLWISQNFSIDYKIQDETLFGWKPEKFDEKEITDFIILQ